MSEMFYRVQSGDRDASDLLDPEQQISRAWHRDDLDRTGVSSCTSLEELAAYLAGPGSGIPYGLPGWVLVAMRGDQATARGLDAEYGEVLIHPTEIADVRPIPDELFDLIGAAYDAMEIRP